MRDENQSEEQVHILAGEHVAHDQIINILESFTDGFIALDKEWRYTYINREADKYLKEKQRTRLDLIGKRIWEQFPRLKETVLYKEFHRAMAEKVTVEFEYFHEILQIWLEMYVYPSEYGLSIFFRDITGRKRTEEQIRASLEEKELLLKEIHHRVKNNLQVVSSLLSLQAGSIKDKQVVDVLKESQNRVRSMALIHEKLYKSRDLSRIDFAEYIRTLADNLFRSYRIDRNTVTLRLDIDNLSMGIDIAIPCGLIINELISNSLKHAFPGGRMGEIYIRFYSVADKRLELIIGDDGVGLPEDFDFQKTESLGFQLVNILTEQLQGTIKVGNDKGTEFSIKFAG
jgi:two-component sensor histidine kinase